MKAANIFPSILFPFCSDSRLGCGSSPLVRRGISLEKSHARIAAVKNQIGVAQILGTWRNLIRAARTNAPPPSAVNIQIEKSQSNLLCSIHSRIFGILLQNDKMTRTSATRCRVDFVCEPLPYSQLPTRASDTTRRWPHCEWGFLFDSNDNLGLPEAHARFASGRSVSGKKRLGVVGLRRNSIGPGKSSLQAISHRLDSELFRKPMAAGRAYAQLPCLIVSVSRIGWLVKYVVAQICWSGRL
jgi:hypothetical protein